MKKVKLTEDQQNFLRCAVVGAHGHDVRCRFILETPNLPFPKLKIDSDISDASLEDILSREYDITEAHPTFLHLKNFISDHPADASGFISLSNIESACDLPRDDTWFMYIADKDNTIEFWRIVGAGFLKISIIGWRRRLTNDEKWVNGYLFDGEVVYITPCEENIDYPQDLHNDSNAILFPTDADINGLDDEMMKCLFMEHGHALKQLLIDITTPYADL